MSKEKKQKLKECQKNYREAKNLSIIMNGTAFLIMI